MMDWKFNEDTPIYQQIMDLLKQQIATGDLSPGEKIRPVRELALEAGVNPNTMQKALSEMEREGYFYSQRTSGRFVAEQQSKAERLSEELMNGYIETFLENMKKLGISSQEALEILERYINKEGN